VLYGPPFFRLIMGHAPLTKEFSEAIHVVMVKRPGDFSQACLVWRWRILTY
jgi:hypothetical protein